MNRNIFREQPSGYDKNQVENYVQKLKKAYETAYREYLDMIDKYNELAKRFYQWD